MLSLLCASTALADFDRRIQQARQLSLTDPTGTGLELLRQLSDLRHRASPSQRAEIELMEIRAIGLQGRMAEAIDQARALSDRAPTDAQRAAAMQLAARLAIDAGHYELAFNQLQGLLDNPTWDESPRNQVPVYAMVSAFHSRSADTLLAMDYAEKALISARAQQDGHLECLALKALGRAHAAIADLDTAQALAAHALELCEQARDTINRIALRIMLARFALEAGQLDQAERLLNESSSDRPRRFPALWTESEIIRARIELEAGNNADALERFQGLGQALGSSQRRDLLARVLDGAADAANRLGDLPKALAFHKSSLAARREHIDRINSLRVAQLAIDFDRVLDNREIELLRERERYRDLSEQSRSQRRQLVTLATLGGSILALLLIASLLYTLRERRHYRKLSERDSLTGLFNHTRFFNQLEREVEERGPRPLILILADVDHFKQVNDRFGHQIGDEVLRQTARILKEIFGENQLIGRVGGEEFAIRLQGQNQTEAVERIDLLQKRLGGKARRPTDPPITLSFGLGVLADGETPEQLRQRTDIAMYEAKAKGRNRLVVSDGPSGDD